MAKERTTLYGNGSTKGDGSGSRKGRRPKAAPVPEKQTGMARESVAGFAVGPEEQSDLARESAMVPGTQADMAWESAAASGAQADMAWESAMAPGTQAAVARESVTASGGQTDMAQEPAAVPGAEADLTREMSAVPTTEEEVIQALKGSPGLYDSFRQLNEPWKQYFLEFCQGKKTLPLTYDPFFKKIFHPDVHPDRLSRFISSILGMEVKVVRILPNEDSALDGGTLLIMDILVELEDGSLVTVEIQKQGYAFPAERMSCYSSDLVMRQYARVKGERGKGFTYRDMKRVYVIVIFEKSTGEFHRKLEAYVHHGKTVFDTELELKLLQEYFLISLDVFDKFPYPRIRSEQTAWLSLLATKDAEDAEKLTKEYPEYRWIQEIYEEMAMLRHKPEEVLGMFSEALKILDRNTVTYMIEEMKKELDEKDVVIGEKDAVIGEKDAMLEEKDAVIGEKDAMLEEKDAMVEALKRQLKHYQK